MDSLWVRGCPSNSPGERGLGFNTETDFKGESGTLVDWIRRGIMHTGVKWAGLVFSNTQFK